MLNKCLFDDFESMLLQKLQFFNNHFCIFPLFGFLLFYLHVILMRSDGKTDSISSKNTYLNNLHIFHQIQNFSFNGRDSTEDKAAASYPTYPGSNLVIFFSCCSMLNSCLFPQIVGCLFPQTDPTN